MKLRLYRAAKRRHESAPTRGPWIEIQLEGGREQQRPSAPTRGPWIEIPWKPWEELDAVVGPHTGAVD